MTPKDRRLKICSNRICYEENKSRYQPEKDGCPFCGSILVFACKNCQQEIRDVGQGHRICERCKAVKKDLTDRSAEKIGVALSGAAGVGAIAYKYRTQILKVMGRILK